MYIIFHFIVYIKEVKPFGLTIVSTETNLLVSLTNYKTNKTPFQAQETSL